MNRRFESKSVLITGAATGIGRATALRAASEGARLVCVDYDEAAGADTVRLATEAGASAHFLKGDVSDPEVANKAVALTVKLHGGLDVAINNAGIMGRPAPVHLLSDDAWQNVLAVNLSGVFFSCRAELAQLVSQGRGGAIVNVGSIAALTGLPGNPAYVASKHGVSGLTRNIAVDYAKHGIRCNSVNPAGTATPMTEAAYRLVSEAMAKAVEAGMDPREATGMAGQKTESLMKRQATPEEQAAVILFLASEEASNITGVLMPVDGGWTAF